MANLKIILKPCLWIFLALIPHANAQTLGLLDDGLSPLERYAAGTKITGVYKAENSLYCSPSAKSKYIPEALPESTVHFQTRYSSVTAGTALTEVNRIASQALATLSLYGDSETVNKYICTSFYREKESQTGNAKSHVHGYMIFDFNLFQHLNALPDDKKSFWIYDFLVLHEFAHQLQFWNADEEMLRALKGEQSAKISELAADCTAAALLKLMNLNLSQQEFAQLFQGATGVAHLLGDFSKDSLSHHGTPAERTFATSYGVGYISSLFENISSKNILNACNQFANQFL